MLQDAKMEILKKIGTACGYEVKEEELSPQAKESIVSIAQTYKQLTVIRELLLVEQKDARRAGARLKRALTGEKDRQLLAYMEQLTKLHQLLDEQVKTVAKQVQAEMQSKFGSEPGASEQIGKRVLIERLKCENCGADLKLSAGLTMKCEYCGATYAMAEYLDKLGETIQGKQQGTQSSS